MSMRVGHILRHEDESGVSGTGIVAEWVEYSDGEVVVHWLSHTPSTNHYRNFKQVDAIHGHGGKTELIVIWEEPKPEPKATPEDAEEASQESAEEAALTDPEPPVELPAKSGTSKKRTSRKKSSAKKKPEKED